MKKILIIAAHPDDEILGCGGYIAKQVHLKNKVFVLYLSEGVSARYSIDDNSQKIDLEILNRKKMAINVSNFLKFSIVDFLDYKNLRMSNVDILDIVKKISSTIKSIKPDIILTNHSGDLNTDHKVAFEATYTACRPLTLNYNFTKFYTYEVMSSTNWSNLLIGPNFNPNTYIEIKDFINIKKKALKFYNFEMRNFPHPRSWKSILSHHISRGSDVGLEYAEAFSLIKDIDHN